MSSVLMPKGTAVWLVDNTTLTFDQIAKFVGLHPLEVQSIADGEVAVGIKPMDPISNKQLTREELERCQKDPAAELQLYQELAPPDRSNRRRGKFVPTAVKENRPAAIAWLLRYHPELSTAQLVRLLGTTKNTVESVRQRTHWNIRNIRPTDPVSLGLCSQVELDKTVQKAMRSKAKTPEQQAKANAERRRLLETDESAAIKEPLRPIKTFEGLENFSIMQQRGQSEDDVLPPSESPESYFNLPSTDDSNKSD